jgi:cellulose synthase/poly-beta-1,6-N-acetylglucosamine synthase-like glycosyltransferase
VSLLGCAYLVATVLLAVYGLNSLVLTWLYLRHRREDVPHLPLTETPAVTVQLPIYNELYVVERLIDAVVRLDYPRDRLQIQVLDDSTDETTAVARARVGFYRAQGVDIELIHRAERMGFKAGALRHGLAKARGEFIAIFDADFVPEPDFLAKTIPYFFERPRLGMIQTRWGHINADYSPLTRAQAIALDGHFVVEQTARNRSGLFMSFNGTAGIWRRECIEASGGWQGDTVSEDLDLSYRAQLLGWQFLFLPDVLSPAEIPPQINAFKRQQFRWAKGSIQCALKLWRPVLKASVPIFKRLQAMIHLTSYLVHPLMLFLCLSSLPLMLWRGGRCLPLAYLSLASLGPPLLYALSQRSLYTDWLKRFTYFPGLIFLGTGIALNNTRAIWEALTQRENDFRRTPKFCLEERKDRWAGRRYSLSLNWVTLGEFVFALYAALTAWVTFQWGNYWTVPFFLLYVGGFSYVAFCSLWHSLLDRGLPLAILKRCLESCPELCRRAAEGRGERSRQMGSRSLPKGGERRPEGRKPSLEKA